MCTSIWACTRKGRGAGGGVGKAYSFLIRFFSRDGILYPMAYPPHPENSVPARRIPDRLIPNYLIT